MSAPSVSYKYGFIIPHLFFIGESFYIFYHGLGAKSNEKAMTGKFFVRKQKKVLTTGEGLWYYECLPTRRWVILHIEN